MKKFVKCTAVAAVSVIASAVLADSSHAEDAEISGSADGSIRIFLDTEDIFVRAGVLFASTKVLPKKGAPEIFFNSVAGCTKGEGKIVWGPSSQWGPDAAIKLTESAWVANGSKVLDQVSKAICIRSSLAMPRRNTATRAYVVPQSPAAYGRM
jgi:hypothetical protein